MAVRAYMSGVESPQHFQQCVDAGVRHVLMSFWQFRGKNENIVKERKKRYPKMRFMVDSGAHTFLDDQEKRQFANWKEKDYEDYVKEYVDWLKRNARYLTCAVEFDIEGVLNNYIAGSSSSSYGLNVVERWQRQYFEPLAQIGLSVIFVWHVERKMEGWEKMCQRFSYVGLPGGLSKEADFNKFIVVARRYTARIHGFAATKQSDYRDHPWYSIDSITWKTGEMYGTIIDWNEPAQRLTFKDKDKRPSLRVKFQQNGFDAEGIIADKNYKEVTRYSLWSMRQMEHFYERRYKDRIFYYELRLPVPSVIKKWKQKRVWRTWQKLFRPKAIFKMHADAKVEDAREFLCAISCVQNADLSYLDGNKKATEFLGAYFSRFITPAITADVELFQREMAIHTSPPNPPPLRRVEAEHFMDNEFAPRRRETVVDTSQLDFELPSEVESLLTKEALRFNYRFK